jgi:hypothetical protein
MRSRFSNAGFSGGYNHISGYQGLNGFDVGAEVVAVRPVSIAFDYDGVWNNSNLGVFQISSVGLTTVKTHVQDWIVGPRIYFPGVFKNKSDAKGPCGTSWGSLRSLMPFLEAQFGESHINSTLTSVGTRSNSASDTAFAWELGGGADVRLNPHWAFRAKLDLLRTHFSDTGQSHARLVLGLAYTIKPREKW